MSDRIVNDRRQWLSAAAIALLVAAGGLSGCANLGDGPVSGAFVDPAKYDLYDCPQLDAQRKSLAARTAELQRLIDKAHTGVAGSVVGEVAYRNDYITVRASAKLAEEVWQRNKCHEAAPAAIIAPASSAGGAPPPRRRSGSAVY
ncbi:twin-arginine translocation pathway signal [Nitrobacter sp. NHB1]|uniref:twin-arginine translocation pathway signal n=1 Tax=Nitrobacter sp. NHB1 TaxID=3119830 RepID=UPI002FFF2751